MYVGIENEAAQFHPAPTPMAPSNSKYKFEKVTRKDFSL
jgi:hypothetical protein